MKPFSLKSAALFALASTVMALLMQACGGSNDARAQATNPPDPIEGFWQSSVTLRDCTSSATIGGFRGLTVFNQGGTAGADNSQPSATKGPAMGSWKKATNGTYTVQLRFWRYAADGTLAGQQRVTRTITLGADGQSLTSTITSQAFDNADNLVQTACGAETGVRIN